MQNGKQRWFCKDCGRYCSKSASVSAAKLYEEYTAGKQTLNQLSKRHKISVSTVQRRLQTLNNQRLILKNKDVVVLMDATYLGRKFGVLVFKDAHRNKILWRKFLSKKETVADYEEGVQWLENQGLNIVGVVCDGLKDLTKILSKYKVQFCQFHQVKIVKFYLTNRENFLKQRTFDPKTGATLYTHSRLRSAYLSLKRNMNLLWTFYDFPDLNLPNTNNGIEALFADLKSKMRVHNGLSKSNRMKFIDHYFFLKNAGAILTNR